MTATCEVVRMTGDMMASRRTRVLFVAHSGFQGGAELCLDTTLAHLDQACFEPFVVFAGDGPLVARARDYGCHVEIWPLSWWLCFEPGWWHYKNLLGTVPRVARLVRFLRYHQIDLVYTNTAVLFEGALAARRARLPHVWHVHEVLTAEHMRPRMLPLSVIAGLIDGLSNRVIFESESSRRIASRWIALEKSTAIHNSVRLVPTGAIDRTAARRRIGVPAGATVFAFLGRFSDRKNPLLLAEALAQLPRDTPLHVMFVGEGPLETQLRDRLAALGLNNRTTIVPFQSDVSEVLAASDVVVLPSNEESFGLVLVEAAAFARPVIATRTQGPSEIVVDGVTGLLVPPRDVAALASAMRTLVDDAELRDRLGQAGAARAAEWFSAPRNTQLIEQTLVDVLDNARSAKGRPQ
ncbi:MAG: glycosyltransferase [Pirellulales bacterium]|nr:glycosyltransferase [Pirellulales bacterium]